MPSRDPQDILKEATRLRDERFAKRNTMLKRRAAERFNETAVEVPAAYRKTTQEHRSNIIDDEGRQVATLVFANPTFHIEPPAPEDQPSTTKCEQFLTAAFQELETHYGPVNWQTTLAQTHDNIGWTFLAPKKVAYKGQPKAPPDDADESEKLLYDVRNERYKRDAGIRAVFDYEYAVTSTVFYDGNVYHPHCVYVWKQVTASTFKKQYGLEKRNGKVADATNIPGYPKDSSTSETMVDVIEYWDDTDCVILTDDVSEKWEGGKQVKGAYVLSEWTHDSGRVPYFARPCFVTEQLDEEKKFAGPLDGIHNEMPNHKRLRTMMDSVAYQTAFAPLKITTSEQSEAIMDDNGNMATFLEFEPGKARQLAPGQDVEPVGQSPEIRNLALELAASEQRIARYTLSPVAKGVSPGADTANAALSNLHRFQLSTLDPMAEQNARQASAMARYMLEWIQKLGETVFVFNEREYLSLGPEDIVSVNVQAKAVPDQGQQQLLIEKHAAELWQAGAISKIDMYEMMGYENPEQKAQAVEIEQYATTLKPIIWQQVTTLLGMTDAINQMIQANAETGSAANAIPGLMQQAQGLQQGQPSGMGQGSPGQPRTPGTRMATADVNTQAGQASGY